MTIRHTVLALIAPLIVASCITVNIAPATPGSTRGSSGYDFGQGTLAPRPMPTPPPSSATTKPPPVGWILAPCTEAEAVGINTGEGAAGLVASLKALEYLANGGCLVPASPVALVGFFTRLDPRLDASIQLWLDQWRATGYNLGMSGIAARELGNVRAGLLDAFRVGTTTRTVTVPECAYAARDTLVKALDALLAAFGAADGPGFNEVTLNEARAAVTRADALIASVKAMESPCPG